MAARRSRTRLDSSPYKRPEQAQANGIRRFLSSLIWGKPKSDDDAEEQTEDDTAADQDSDIQQLPRETPSSPAAASGWNDPPSQAFTPPPRSRTLSDLAATPTQTLEDFFRRKREANESVTAEEAADVVRLVNEAQQPSWTGRSAPRRSLAPPPSSTQLFPSSPFANKPLSSSVSMPSLSSKMFPASTSPSLSKTTKRPRHLYLGPGHGSQSVARRRGRLAPGVADLRSIKSEANLVGPSTKRRRVNDNPVFDQASVAPSTPSSQSTFSPRALPTPLGAFGATGGLTGPRTRDFKRPAVPEPQKTPGDEASSKRTRAADIMLDIIRSTEESGPAIAAPDILNPYDREDTPMARIHNTRSRSVASPKPSARKVASKSSLTSPKKPMSAKERLEKSMPVEYRRALEEAELPEVPPELLQKDTPPPKETRAKSPVLPIRQKPSIAPKTQDKGRKLEAKAAPLSAKAAPPIISIDSSSEASEAESSEAPVAPKTLALPPKAFEAPKHSKSPSPAPAPKEPLSPRTAALNTPEHALPSFDFQLPVIATVVVANEASRAALEVPLQDLPHFPFLI